LKEIVYLDQESTITKEAFANYFFFDKRYRAKVKNINIFIDILFNAFDRDQDGAISFNEFLVGKEMFESKSQQEFLKFIFKLFDLSKDKMIEKNEIELFLNSLTRAGSTYKLSDKSETDFAQEMMDDLDFDKNGTLNEDEFIEVYYIIFIYLLKYIISR
jgi:Ca2+-binding EF-hand superfamily protein